MCRCSQQDSSWHLKVKEFVLKKRQRLLFALTGTFIGPLLAVGIKSASAADPGSALIYEIIATPVAVACYALGPDYNCQACCNRSLDDLDMADPVTVACGVVCREMRDKDNEGKPKTGLPGFGE